MQTIHNVIDASATDKILIKNLTRTFKSKQGEFTAIEDVSFNIRKGEFCVIVGPSGCGKTTILRILAGLEKQTSGSVQVIRDSDSGKPLNSMVFQEASAFPWMTVQQNVEYGLRMRKVNKQARSEIAHEWIKKIGLERFSESFPHQLSGGMKQRVSVARAFANDPEILLMDEPFAALDEQNRAVLQEELLRIWEGTSKTVVFITHSIDEAVTLADRVLVMGSNPGRIKTVLNVDFPRPRKIYDMRKDPKYGEMVYNIWNQLHPGGK